MNLQELSLRAARAGATAIRAVVDGKRLDVTYKDAADRDPVTAADQASEQAICALVSRYREVDSILSEESGETGGPAGASGTRWIIDPLDGTANFVHGMDRYAVSVAAETTEVTGAAGVVGRRRVVAAAVLQPVTGRWLALDAGGKPVGNVDQVGVNTDAVAERALLAFAVPNAPAARRRAYRALTGLAPRVQDLRNFGSTVCDLFSVATAELDGFVSFDPAPWDVAAGAALVEAAGGESRRFVHRDGMRVIVCGPAAVVTAVSAWLGAPLPMSHQSRKAGRP
ncbi:inositol monophosphatase family protein [Streptomyces sp. NPDC059568]|uniref:inositol monophosphatase family protein n=1 Tax=Streptomyces sp. NPDC059568 TaxID=3346868 RepID=UPI003694DE72